MIRCIVLIECLLRLCNHDDVEEIVVIVNPSRTLGDGFGGVMPSPKPPAPPLPVGRKYRIEHFHVPDSCIDIE